MDKSKKADPRLRNVKMVVEYEGTDYCGWQNQINGVTVQSVVEKCLSRLVGGKTKIMASGRTDSGVHAFGQVINVKAPFRMDDDRLVLALNTLLPPDISIKNAVTVDDGFSALKNAKWKTYRYFIHNGYARSPMARRTSWHFPVSLNVSSMQRAAKILVGKHDFASFMGSNSSIKTSVRKINSITIKRKGEMVVFEITGEGFLKYMVRIIVGTLVEIGRGKRPEDQMKKIIAAKKRKASGPTAPARGLSLVEVGY